MADILIVEDKESLRAMLRKTLDARGYSVDEAADAYEARRRLASQRYLVVLTDLKLPAGSGFDVLHEALEADPETAVVVMTAFGTVEEAVRAMKDGASDFLTKPVDTDHLLLLLDRAVERRRLLTELVLLKDDHQQRFGLPRVLGEDPAFRDAMLALQRAAPGDTTVLLLGESGTGKELLARALHQLSPRAKGPFVAINCAAIPENLLENELFGHEKGAFTGATARKVGKAELAHKGTLFLDEIGDMPLPLQGKILRLVQEKQFERVGGLATLTVDVRVVAATNHDLRALVDEKLFREDLFFRLSVMPIEIPPLGQRANRARGVHQLHRDSRHRHCATFRVLEFDVHVVDPRRLAAKPLLRLADRPARHVMVVQDLQPLGARLLFEARFQGLDDERVDPGLEEVREVAFDAFPCHQVHHVRRFERLEEELRCERAEEEPFAVGAFV